MQLRGYYRSGDYVAMHHLDLLCFEPAFQFDLETMQQAAEDPAAIVVVAEREPDREMIGFVILHLLRSSGRGTRESRKDAYVVTLDVAPGARRSGIATVMLTHAEEQARVAGAHRVALHVAVNNTAAIAFYQRQKYACAGTADSFYREAGLDAFIYAKQLEKPGAR